MYLGSCIIIFRANKSISVEKEKDKKISSSEERQPFGWDPALKKAADELRDVLLEEEKERSARETQR